MILNSFWNLLSTDISYSTLLIYYSHLLADNCAAISSAILSTPLLTGLMIIWPTLKYNQALANLCKKKWLLANFLKLLAQGLEFSGKKELAKLNILKLSITSQNFWNDFSDTLLY